MYDMRIVGLECRKVRRNLDMSQAQVATELGYTPQSISAFERGRTNNAILLLWYLKHGLSLNAIERTMLNGAYKS